MMVSVFMSFYYALGSCIEPRRSYGPSLFGVVESFVQKPFVALDEVEPGGGPHDASYVPQIHVTGGMRVLELQPIVKLPPVNLPAIFPSESHRADHLPVAEHGDGIGIGGFKPPNPPREYG